MDIRIKVLLYVIVFICLVVGFYLLFRSVIVVNTAKENMKNIYAVLHAQNEIRVEQLELNRRMYGVASIKDGGKIGFLEKMLLKIDDALIYSEMSIRYRWLNTSTYIVLSVLVASLCMMTGIILLDSVVAAIIISVVIVLAPYVYMVHLCDKNYKKTEKQLIFFINMISNNSLVTNSIISVLETTVKYTKEPLNGAINRALADAKLVDEEKDGTVVCIDRLTREIEHPLFVRFVRNLEICSRSDADYRSVARDFSKQVEISLEALEMRRTIYTKKRNEVLIMMFFYLIALWLSCSFLGLHFMNVIGDLANSFLGALTLIIECIVLTIVVVYVVVGSRR